MNFYIFDSEQAATTEEQRVTANIRAWVAAHDPTALTPDGALRSRSAQTGDFTKSFTTRWAEPRQRMDGKWVLPKPEANRIVPIPIETALDGVTAPVEVYSENWFPLEEN